jgi:AbrB family looped-hinge helix DNA binding protein
MALTTQDTGNYAITLGDRGRLVLPAAVRKGLDLHGGDRLILTVEKDGGLRLVRAQDAARSARGLLREAAGERSLSTELLEERKREAARE